MNFNFCTYLDISRYGLRAPKGVGATAAGVKNDTFTVSSTESNNRGNENSEQKATATSLINNKCPNTDYISKYGLYLPTGYNLNKKMIKKISKKTLEIFRKI